MTHTTGTGFFLPTYSPINQRDRNHEGSTCRGRTAVRGQADHFKREDPITLALQHKMQELALQQSNIPSPEMYPDWMLSSASPYSSFSASSSCFSTDAPLSEPCSLGPCYSNSSSITSSTQYPSQSLAQGYPVSTPSLQHYNLAQAIDQEVQEMQMLQQQEAGVDAAIRNLLALRQQLAGMMTPPAAPAPTAVPAPPVSPPAPLFSGPTSVSRATSALAAARPVKCVPASMHPAAAAVPASPAAAAQLHLAQLQARQQQLLGFEQQLQLQLQAEVARLWAIV